MSDDGIDGGSSLSNETITTSASPEDIDLDRRFIGLGTSSLMNAVYYPNWRVYQQQPPSSLNLQYITHIFYAFAWPATDGSIEFSDKYADLDINIKGAHGCLADLKRVKQQNPRIKTLISMGGYGKGTDRLAAVTSSSKLLDKFTAATKQLIQTYNLDGVDIDWEFPTGKGQPQQYLQMLQHFRQALPLGRYLVTTATSAGTWVLQNLDIAMVARLVDLVNLMAYDFSGPWTSKAGHQSQLYSPQRPYNDDAKLSADSAVRYLLGRGVPSAKILLGIPAYGRSFLGASKAGDSYTGQGGTSGTFDYRSLPRPGSRVYYDSSLGATYAVGGDGGFVSFDDPRSVQAKVAYVKRSRLGGVFFWAGTSDTNDARSLVKASRQAM